MRERKRLESMLSLEGDLARRHRRHCRYFDLAGEGERHLPNCSANSNLSRTRLRPRSEPRTLLWATTTAERDHDDASRAGGTVAGLAEDLLRMYLRLGRTQDSRPRDVRLPARRRSGYPSRDVWRDWADAFAYLTADLCATDWCGFPFRQASGGTRGLRVYVSPEIDTASRVNIKPDDLRIDTTVRVQGRAAREYDRFGGTSRTIPTGCCQLPRMSDRSTRKQREGDEHAGARRFYEFELEKKREGTKKLRFETGHRWIADSVVCVATVSA